MAQIQSFRDLEVYRLARQVSKQLFALSQSFPREERYSLTDQIRRSSRAIGAMIAEAWARRQYPAVFVNKLSEALGEASETQAWLDHCLDCVCISEVSHSELNLHYQHIGAMLRRMIDRAETFCPPRANHYPQKG